MTVDSSLFDWFFASAKRAIPNESNVTLGVTLVEKTLNLLDAHVPLVSFCLSKYLPFNFVRYTVPRGSEVLECTEFPRRTVYLPPTCLGVCNRLGKFDGDCTY